MYYLEFLRSINLLLKLLYNFSSSLFFDKRRKLLMDLVWKEYFCHLLHDGWVDFRNKEEKAYTRELNYLFYKTLCFIFSALMVQLKWEFLWKEDETKHQTVRIVWKPSIFVGDNLVRVLRSITAIVGDNGPLWVVSTNNNNN